ncbi:hypothetical protein [Salisediminibacterium beveridgei]|uniref:Dynamin family protein n=1 Tax=Salisediminibacterium beveridgei TaxID=632773 RepID=A0A1D7QZM1_9BACI|nr:hypothetical protein [Salisediminibacterium beveridgei]AOM84456.1 hypothetical protein BBEV_3140 [Salisediminibacterium beveridgei]
MKNYYLNQIADHERWVVEAIKSFNSGFKRFQPINLVKNEVRIGLYGPTQVGKTTFILTLLGVGANKIKELSNALRAGRPLGKSSTITTFIYKRSNDRLFKVIDLQTDTIMTFNSLNELSEYLGELRNKIENDSNHKQLKQSHTYELHVSNEYITNPVLIESSKNFQLIDLPGFDTRESREKRYVERLLNEQLGSCDVVIIMEIFNQMVHLQSDSFSRFSNWKDTPEKYRVVLTRSFSDQSVMDKVSNGSIQSKEDMLEYTNHNLNEVSELGIPIDNVYPLEFGDSFLQLSTSDVYSASDVLSWLNDFYFTLANSLYASGTIEAQITNMRNSKYKMIQKEEKDIQTKKIEVSKICNKITPKNNTVKKNNALIDELQSENSKMIEMNDLLNNFTFIDFNCDELDELKSEYIFNLTTQDDENKEESFLFAERLFRSGLNLISIADFSALTKSLNIELEKIEKTFDLDLSDDILHQLNMILSSFINYKQIEAQKIMTINKYHEPFDIKYEINIDPKSSYSWWRNLASNAKNKRRKILLHLLREYYTSLNFLESAWSEYQKSTHQILQIKIAKNNWIISSVEKKISKLKYEKELLETKIDELKNDISEIEKEWQEDKMWLDSLDQHLITSWLEEYDRLTRDLIQPLENAIELWVTKYKLNLLMLQGEGLIKLESTENRKI